MIAKPKKEIRVRIAPSPTGYLHIGTARTALFNWLFAKNQGGKFILRIEDTDLERSDPKFEKDIIENLKWLGLDWDEGPIADAQNQKSKIKNKNYIGDYGPYKQSERLDTYEKYINQLLDQNLAYYCDCAEEELEIQRQAMMTQGLAPKYSGKCRALNLKEGYVIRFKIPETKISFNDIIRGELTFDGALIGDIAIAKPGSRNLTSETDEISSRVFTSRKNPRFAPLYNFAVVVDDYEMKISHVIRGEDHIANTPRQIFIQKALGFPEPKYAHLPLILNPDRSKMSKRFAATSVNEYKEAGYLPDALVNFMAFLGWHPAPQSSAGVRGKSQQEKEIYSLKELVKEFDLSRAQKGGAVFNIEKLNWLNAQYLKKFSDGELAKILQVENSKIVALVRERMKKLSDFNELAGFFSELPDYPPKLLIWKTTPKETTKENLGAVLKILPDQEKIMRLAQERGKGEVLWPLRVALSGKDASSGPLEILDALGEKEARRRIDIAIRKLGTSK